MPGQAEQQKGVGIAVQHRIEPAAEVAALVLEPCHFAVTTVDDGCELCQDTAQEQGKIPTKRKQSGGQQGAQKREQGNLIGRHIALHQISRNPHGEWAVQITCDRPVVRLVT